MKAITKITALGICTLALAGCGKVPKLSNGDDILVSIKDNDISANDLYNELKNSYALEALINMVDKKILESEYPDDLEDAKEYAESQVASIKESYGDDALQAIQYYTNFSTFEAYESYLYLSYLQNQAIENYAKGKVSEKEIEKYYKDEVVGDIKVSHILITPEVKDGMSEEDKKKAEDAAKETVNKILKELKAAEKDKTASKFAELAKEYSKDESNKDNGGSLGFINKGTLDSNYDELVDAAYKLKDGEYTTNFVTTELGYHIVLRVETKEKAKLEDVKDSIIESLAEKKITDDKTLTITAMQELRKKYDMEINDDEIQKQYANYIQGSLNSIKNQESSTTK